MSARPAARPAGANRSLPALLLAAALTGCGPVEDPGLFPEYSDALAETAPAKAAVAANPVRNLLWGDLHIHTSYSTDAYTMGVRATPDDAYDFARGATIEHGAGYPIRISRPLDFAAVTDHAEYMGVLRASGMESPLSRRSLRERLLHDSRLSFTLAYLDSVLRFGEGNPEIDAENPDAIMIDTWRDTVAIADSHNRPGEFTALVGYEWTSMPEQQNLHRNVIYRDAHVPRRPFSSLDSPRPEELWNALDRQRALGMRMIAIPHNANLSNGLMYARTTFDGTAPDAAWAAQRLRNEPVSEIMQVKGSSETHPALSPQDEFADFEILDQLLSRESRTGIAQGSYARDALRTGIEFAHAEGFNPYRFGVIGSSDSHNASSAVEENAYHGKLPLLDGSAALRLGKVLLLPESMQRGGRWGAAGLAAVWAEENTRESIFDALERRECYATSGPRIQLRFFGGWEYEASMLEDPALLERAYAGGVPMGGELPPGPAGQRPRFLVWAAKDPDGANLDRLQIVKGWVDAGGRSHEQVFDVAASAPRERGSDGRYAPVGNTVDVASASYSNEIGAADLAVLWEDPEFDAGRQAFYYARAIEIPTPRWSTFDARTLQAAPPDPASIQERAISSAIWLR